MKYGTALLAVIGATLAIVGASLLVFGKLEAGVPLTLVGVVVVMLLAFDWNGRGGEE